MEHRRICQSCAMPMTENAHFGKNADGSKNEEYCCYCYSEGKFSSEENMEEMIASCIPHCLGGNPYSSEEEARSAMLAFFPQLKRWKK